MSQRGLPSSSGGLFCYEKANTVKAKVVRFGEIEVEGEHYDHDVVIDCGKVTKRKKGPSKRFRGEYGHTPLSAEEHIPWGGDLLIVGTGLYGKLPIMPAVRQEAKRQGISLVAVPTEQACELLDSLKPRETHAVLHVTC